MAKAYITSKITLELSLLSVSVSKDAVIFRTDNSTIRLTVNEWEKLGKPSKLHIDIYPEPDDDE